MIAVDTNLLVYAHRRDSPFHAAAASAIRGLAQGPAPWALPWPCVHEFYSIATHPRIYDPPSSPDEAMGQIDAWLESPTVLPLSEGDSYWQALRALLAGAKVTGPLVHDARIVALCVSKGVKELWTADRDFTRFPQVKVINPLV